MNRPWRDGNVPAVIRVGRRHVLDGLVPLDRFHQVRRVAILVYAAVYLWWTRTQGLVNDRISVVVALVMFLVAANLGRPARRWATLSVDVALYALMWLAYETTRGAADRLGMPLQLEAVRNIDRFLFFGADPNVVLQDALYRAGDIRWYDHVLSLVYYTHFVVPVVAIAVVWVIDRALWVRFMRRFATLLAVACTMFVLLPTIPPWMAADPKYGYRAIEPLARHTGRGFVDLGFYGFFHDWRHALDWGNPVAAMPSLHTGFAAFVAVFFLPMIRSRLARIALLVGYPGTMLVALVYFAEHWVIDGLVAFALVGGVFRLWDHLEARQRGRRAQTARAHLLRISAPVPSALSETR